jgi:hypothetical protein
VKESVNVRINLQDEEIIESFPIKEVTLLKGEYENPKEEVVSEPDEEEYVELTANAKIPKERIRKKER